MHPFEVRAPAGLDEAIEVRHRYGGDSTVLAGGQSLMILLRQGLVSPTVLLSLKRVEELRNVQPAGGDGADAVFRIGATVTYREAAHDPAIRSRLPVLARAAGRVGSVHIRYLGTLGGSVCHADPSGDVPTVLLAVDGQVTVRSSAGTTQYPVGEFFTDMFQTRLGDTEVLTEITVPPMQVGSSFGYRRFSYREGEYPLAVAACCLQWSQDGTCTDARVAVGGGDVHPKRLVDCEQLLVGTTVDASVVAAMSDLARSSLRPVADVRGDEDWKRVVVAGLVGQAVGDAAARDASSTVGTHA